MPTKRKKRYKEPPLLMASDYFLISAKETVGLVFLLTDKGEIDFAVNKTSARQLMVNLRRFLDGVQSPYHEDPPA